MQTVGISLLPELTQSCCAKPDKCLKPQWNFILQTAVAYD